MKTIDYEIEFLADWHIGTGRGRHGHLDRTYDRDEHGLPFVGAKTMKGLLRSSMEQIAFGLDGGADGTNESWGDLARWLLGSQPTTDEFLGSRTAPQPGVLVLTRAGLEPAVAATVLARPALQRALAVERPGVKLDELGTAVQDHLRFIEMAPAGLVLVGRCSVPDDAPDQALALIAAALREIRRIGHRRRRGWGRCSLNVLTEVAALDEETKLPRVPSQSQLRTAEPLPADTIDTLVRHEEYDLRLTALSPLLLPAGRGGNDVTSRATIPGSTLLALLGGLAPVATQQGIADGSLLVGEGLPVLNGEPSMPVPFAWFRYKASVNGSDSSEVISRLVTEPADGRQALQLRNGFVIASANAGEAFIGTPEMDRRVHVGIDDLSQAALDGALYSYSAVAAGSNYSASLMVTPSRAEALANEAGAADLVALLTDEHRIGSSRRNEYGRVDAQAEKKPTSAQASGSDDEVSEFTIWLTADVLPVDNRLRSCPTTAGLAAAVSAGLGREVTISKAFLRRVRRDSWHGRWGLPRPSLVGVSAGSVAICRVADGGTVTRTAVELLGRLGIGERVAEGFGRFVVNHSLLHSTTSVLAVPPQRSTATVAGPLSEAGQVVVERLEQVAWETFIAEQVARAIADGWHRTTLGLGENEPGRSQLGSLRSAVRIDRGDLTATKQWWQAMSAVPRRRKRWPDKTHQAIEALLTNPSTVWNKLGVNDARLHEVGKPTDARSAAAVRTLLGAAAKAGQQDSGSADNEGQR